ncbi:uncharacterized protein [Rutidosis leptorrhynchoides]|uniref:uncharacterized protein n=1 Tax=Rutidosis leptorrhynchoides TaxID=125765 RepID=UPI003A99BCF7
MVVSESPGKFNGGSLPRPRIYTNIIYNSDRADTPLPVLDPLMSWAEEAHAHWPMGALSFHRNRLQGRSPSPPPAPIASKRRRRCVGLVDDDEESKVGMKWLVKKLSFDLVENEKEQAG